MTVPSLDGTLPGTLRFVAYDLTAGTPVLSGSDAGRQVVFCETAVLGLDACLIEIMDYGADAPAMARRDLLLPTARTAHRTIYRGDGLRELPGIPLSSVDMPA